MIDTQPVFIVGSGRSGTTLLRNLLEMHERIGVSPELKFFDRTFAKRKSARGRGVFIKQIFAEMQKSQDPLYKKRPVDYAALHGELSAQSDMRGMFLALLCGTSDKPDAPVLVEKTPRNVFFLDVITTWFPDAKIVHVYRDGRDFCASAMRRGWSLNIMDLVVMWNEALASVRAAAPALRAKDALFEIAYEDIISDPYTVLSDTLRFLGMKGVSRGTFERHVATIDSFSSFFSPEKKGIYRPDHYPETFDTYERRTIEASIAGGMRTYGYHMRAPELAWQDRLRYACALVKHRMRLYAAEHGHLRRYTRIRNRVLKVMA